MSGPSALFEFFRRFRTVREQAWSSCRVSVAGCQLSVTASVRVSAGAQKEIHKMAVPVSQAWTVASYVLKQKLKGRKKYPLVLMLEPLFRCNTIGRAACRHLA